MRLRWFGPKRIGWGVSPRSWEGWLVTLALLAGLAAGMRWLRPLLQDATGASFVTITFAMITAWLLLFAVVIWATYRRD